MTLIALGVSPAAERQPSCGWGNVVKRSGRLTLDVVAVLSILPVLALAGRWGRSYFVGDLVLRGAV